MTKRMRWMMAAMLVAAPGLTAAPALAAAKVPAGVWQNPKGSVRVTFLPCGDAMCGRIVWASAQAQADADAAGGGKLVGTMLFRDFVEEEPHRWSGSVLVPDLGREVTGTIEQVDSRTLVGEGCLFAGFGCKQQVWKRVK